MLTPSIATVWEIGTLCCSSIDVKHVPHVLNYLHQVGSVLYYSHHNFLRDFVFLTPQFVVDVLKTLYRHDISSLTLTAVDQGKASLQQNVTDAEFEVMNSKRGLTENGTVSINFLQLIFSHFSFNSHHYELLVNLLFKFDLAYPKCKDADTHRHITHYIQNTLSHAQSQCYSQLKEKHELPAVTGKQQALWNSVYFNIQRHRTSQSFLSDLDQTLLSALDTSGSSLLLPWFVPDTMPCDIPLMSPSTSFCSQIVSTYAFRYCVPLGLFDRLSARSSRHSIYTRHWKSGLYFVYGPVVAVFQCIPTRPLPAISLTFTATKSNNNVE